MHIRSIPQLFGKYWNLWKQPHRVFGKGSIPEAYFATFSGLFFSEFSQNTGGYAPFLKEKKKKEKTTFPEKNNPTRINSGKNVRTLSRNFPGK